MIQLGRGRVPQERVRVVEVLDLVVERLRQLAARVEDNVPEGLDLMLGAMGVDVLDPLGRLEDGVSVLIAGDRVTELQALDLLEDLWQRIEAVNENLEVTILNRDRRSRSHGSHPTRDKEEPQKC